MSTIDLALLGGLIGTWIAAIIYGQSYMRIVKAMSKDLEAARALLDAETKRHDAHTKAFEALSNPDLIVEEMEKSARATEMRIARRTTLPREDAGPPAKVYRPRILKHYPRSWPR